jgi:hypothetical protein
MMGKHSGNEWPGQGGECGKCVLVYLHKMRIEGASLPQRVKMKDCRVKPENAAKLTKLVHKRISAGPSHKVVRGEVALQLRLSHLNLPLADLIARQGPL